jgi:hypothetical protein
MVTVELDMLEDVLSVSVFSVEDGASSTSGDAGISGGESGNTGGEQLCEPQSMLARRCRFGLDRSSVSIEDCREMLSSEIPVTELAKLGRRC